MGMGLSRRSLFKGLLAVSALRFLPSVPMSAPVAPVVAQILNPFAAGNSDSLTKMILALMDDMDKTEAIGVIRSMPSFRAEMLDDIGSNESVAEAMTRQLGDGQWSEWQYTVDDVRYALSSLDREDELRRQALRYWNVMDGSITDEGGPLAEVQIEMSAVV